MWNKLTARQQKACRAARDQLVGEGWAITVSQLAKHMDATMAYLRGTISAADLARTVGSAERL